MSNIDGIKFERYGRKITVDSDSAEYMLEFNKSEEYFSNIPSYTRFIQACEKVVRSNQRYSNYKKILIEKVKLDHCQVLSDLELDGESGKDIIEMHHGPIFTLYDICEIVLQYYRKKKWPITTMSIADGVLTEHEKNRVQVVMLCSSVHELVHNGSVFLNLDQGYGRLDLFIEKYISVFPEYIKEKYNRYMDRSLLFDSNDFNSLEINQKIFTIT